MCHMAKKGKLMMGINVSYTWEPKWVTEDKVPCLVPAVMNQKGVEWNYVIVCCSPAYNGVWRYKAEEAKKLKT